MKKRDLKKWWGGVEGDEKRKAVVAVVYLSIAIRSHEGDWGVDL